MYSFLRQPRWIVLLILVPILVILFFYLGEWQKSRHDGRIESNAVIEKTMNLPTEPVTQVVADGSSADSPRQWRKVSATGTYSQSGQVLVRKKPMNSKVGYWVVTPLVLDSNQVLYVNRGWIGPSDRPNEPIENPAPPEGVVSITGRIQEFQAPAPRPDDVPAGQITVLNPVQLPTVGQEDVHPIYVNLLESNPPQSASLELMAEPSIDEGPHLSYALQWVAFAAVLIVGIVMLVRREAKTLNDEASDPPKEV